MRTITRTKSYYDAPSNGWKPAVRAYALTVGAGATAYVALAKATDRIRIFQTTLATALVTIRLGITTADVAHAAPAPGASPGVAGTESEFLRVLFASYPEIVEVDNATPYVHIYNNEASSISIYIEASEASGT